MKAAVSPMGLLLWRAVRKSLWVWPLFTVRTWVELRFWWTYSVSLSAFQHAHNPAAVPVRSRFRFRFVRLTRRFRFSPQQEKLRNAWICAEPPPADRVRFGGSNRWTWSGSPGRSDSNFITGSTESRKRRKNFVVALNLSTSSESGPGPVSGSTAVEVPSEVLEYGPDSKLVLEYSEYSKNTEPSDFS